MYLIRGDYKSGYLYYVDTAFQDHKPYITYSFEDGFLHVDVLKRNLIG